MILITLPRDSCAIDVCSQKEPRYGSFPIVRVNETTWKILPVRYTSRTSDGELVSESHVINGAFGMDFVHLLDAIGSEAAHLEALG